VKVLIACEFSGTVRDAFRKLGHDAWSCDIIPTDADPTYHIQGDVLEILNDGWDMMIAHPPCTYLAKSGVQHLHKDPERWAKMEKAREFFLKMLNVPIPKICVENPIPHGYAKLPPYNQIIQPYYFGEAVQKKTCLWLKNLTLLQATNIVDKGENYIGKDGKSNGSKWYQLPPSADRWKIRSKTFQGIADAMAQQWGGNVLEKAV
jgi:hypothetical protein